MSELPFQLHSTGSGVGPDIVVDTVPTQEMRKPSEPGLLPTGFASSNTH